MSASAVSRKTLLVQAVAAAVLAVIFWLLGAYVTKHGEPAPLWIFAQRVRGHAIWVAWAFTNAGWGSVLAPLYACCIAAAIFVRAWRARMLYLVAVALASWGCADYFQRLFARPRRLDWLIRHEHAYSYPSSHAAIATGFYFLAAVLIARSELRPGLRSVLCAFLFIMWIGILWSRLALAAHYPTDLAGGICLGLFLALLGAACVYLSGASLTGQRAKVFAMPGRRS